MGRHRTVPEETAKQIRWLYHNTGCSMRHLALRYGVSTTTVRRIVDRLDIYGQLIAPPKLARELMRQSWE